MKEIEVMDIVKEINSSMVLIEEGKSLHISKYQVTQRQWEAVMGTNPSYFKKGNAANQPVDSVSFNDCLEFISKLNELSGKSYRFPTDAEWEYAAKGGSKSDGTKFSGSNDLNSVAWNYDNSNSSTHPVGMLAPNSIGLYDMLGNVWEWCSDSRSKHITELQNNLQGSSGGECRVIRGGSWGCITFFCHVDFRNFCIPSYRVNFVGLRLARD